MELKKLSDLKAGDLQGKSVLLRADLNVPIKDGVVADDTRIKAVVPTITFLLDHGAKVSILTHLGRPAGKVVEELRTAPIANKLKEFVQGEFEVEENLRFDEGEEKNDQTFAEKLALGHDLFVNDAFASSHRAHASIVGIPKILPSYAGLLMEREVQELSQALTPPPGSVAIIGGAKFETKIPLIAKLTATYSTILLGGALGNDIIKARGLPFGSSLISETPAPTSIAGNDNILMLSDAVLFGPGDHVREGLVSDIRKEEKIVDIGPATAAVWAGVIEKAPFVLWNGPMGVYESGFTKGTDTLAAAVAKTRAVIGGGDTVAAVSKTNFDKEKVFLSTGGGAMLEFLVEGTLVGLEPLRAN